MARFKYSDRDSFERMIEGRAQPTKKSNSKMVITGYKSNVQGFRTIGGKKHFFRSLWEINFCHFLEWQKSNGWIKDWEYEPRLFQFPIEKYKTGPFFYKPDVHVTNSDDSKHWCEIKGWMTKESKKKIKRFNKHYPDEKIFIITGKEMRKIAKYKRMIPNWEDFKPEN